MCRKCQRRRAIGGGAVCNARCTAGARQAHSAALDRACLSCGSPDVTGLCGSCEVERAPEALCDSIAQQAQLLASEAGPSAAPRLPVHPRLRLKARRMRCSQPELDIAIEWERLPERGEDGWWSPTSAMPAPFVEAFTTEAHA
jgi:hypothetical protein